MRHQQVFHLFGGDLLAATIDLILYPADDDEVAIVSLADQVTTPIIGFFPTLDVKHASPEIIAEVSAAFAQAGVDGEVIPVEGAKHGFIDPLGGVYDPVEGPKAWARMLAFFRARL